MRVSKGRVALLAAVLFTAGFSALTLDGVRWRARLLGLKAMGQVPDLEWSELLRVLPSRGSGWLRPLIATPNAYQAVLLPDSSAAAADSGRRLFQRLCSSCHGPEGTGAAAPNLVQRPFRHGQTDWALYRAIGRGFPAAGMPAFRLPARDRWRLVAFLRAAWGETAARRAPPPSPPRAVSAELLRAARADSSNWLTYSGAYDGRRYSLLSQVNRANVGRLRLLWMHQLGGEDHFEASPLILDGTLFFTTPEGGVRALDAETGRVLWSYDRVVETVHSCCGRANRGLAVLGTALFLATLDAHLIALDAQTGAVRWDVTVSRERGIGFTSAPLAVNDLVIIGNAGGEFPTRGFIDAYDAATGARRWRFRTIPGPGESGNASWGGDSWKTGGAPAWLTGSYDPELGLLYWGIGNPNPDYNGDVRPGDNLYTDCVVALDAATGALRWYFQFTPHDLHDWDAAQIPVLAELPAAYPEKLLLWANRNGFYYVLDRATGRFLKGTPFVRQSWSLGLSPEGRPLLAPGNAPTREGTRVYPGVDGGTNWWSPSYNPRTGLFYVQALEREDLVFKGPVEVGPGGDRYGSGRQPAHAGAGRGAIRALDAATGALRWEFETFTSLGHYIEHIGGLLSTAGDLLFGSKEDVFLALDATDGRLLWSFPTGGGIHAAPVTYLSRGRQRVTVAAGHALLTFGLE